MLIAGGNNSLQFVHYNMVFFVSRREQISHIFLNTSVEESHTSI